MLVVKEVLHGECTGCVYYAGLRGAAYDCPKSTATCFNGSIYIEDTPEARGKYYTRRAKLRLGVK